MTVIDYLVYCSIAANIIITASMVVAVRMFLDEEVPTSHGLVKFIVALVAGVLWPFILLFLLARNIFLRLLGA